MSVFCFAFEQSLFIYFLWNAWWVCAGNRRERAASDWSSLDRRFGTSGSTNSVPVSSEFESNGPFAGHSRFDHAGREYFVRRLLLLRRSSLSTIISVTYLDTLLRIPSLVSLSDTVLFLGHYWVLALFGFLSVIDRTLPPSLDFVPPQRRSSRFLGSSSITKPSFVRDKTCSSSTS